MSVKKALHGIHKFIWDHPGKWLNI